MKIPITRNNYQNQFLYVAQDAIDPHFNSGLKSDPNNLYRNTPHYLSNGNLVRQLHRIQSINYGFSVEREDIHEFGQLYPIDRLVTKPPQVYLDFEYLLADGYNEQATGFVVDGKTSFLARHILNRRDQPTCPAFGVGSNFFIVTGPPNLDIIGHDLNKRPRSKTTVVGIGNAFLSQYALSAQVGSIPKARMSYTAYNMRSYKGVSNLPVPSIDPTTSCAVNDINFSIPDTYESFTYPKLVGLEDIQLLNSSRGVSNGSLRLTLGEAGIMTQSGNSYGPRTKNTALVQGLSINVSLGTTQIEKLGYFYELTRLYNFPMEISIGINAILSDLVESNVYDQVCQKKKHTITLEMFDHCAINACDGVLQQSKAHVKFTLKNVEIDSESFQNSIGDPHRMVTMQGSAQVAGPEDNTNGLFVDGKSFFPDAPHILAWGHPLVC
jgi:hypothetical protein